MDRLLDWKLSVLAVRLDSPADLMALSNIENHQHEGIIHEERGKTHLNVGLSFSNPKPLNTTDLSNLTKSHNLSFRSSEPVNI